MAIVAAIALPFTGCHKKQKLSAKAGTSKPQTSAQRAPSPVHDALEWEIADPRYEFPHQPPDVPAPKLARNKQPHPPFLAAHEKYVEIAKAGHVDLVFFGDSITENWRNYPALWESAFGTCHPANFGIGGDRTQHVLWRITNGELDGIQPKVAVVLIGTNNIEVDSTPGIASGVRRIIDTIHEKSPTTRILLMGILPRGENPCEIRDLVKQANVEIAKLQNGQDIVFQDIGNRYLLEDGTLPAELMPDFVHLSEKGARIWADAIKPQIKEWMK